MVEFDRLPYIWCPLERAEMSKKISKMRCCCQMKNNTSAARPLFDHTHCASSSSAQQCVPRHLSRHANSMQISTRRICIRERVKICVPRRVDFSRDTQYVKEDALAASNLINAKRKGGVALVKLACTRGGQ
jgi:hypothetical protein